MPNLQFLKYIYFLSLKTNCTKTLNDWQLKDISVIPVILGAMQWLNEGQPIKLQNYLDNILGKPNTPGTGNSHQGHSVSTTQESTRNFQSSNDTLQIRRKFAPGRGLHSFLQKGNE